jgi:hypothetical protein
VTAGPGHRHEAGHSPAPGALLLAWGDAYDIGREPGGWTAVGGDAGERVFSGDSPAALNAGICSGRARGGTV